jgi:hypothetical protein
MKRQISAAPSDDLLNRTRVIAFLARKSTIPIAEVTQIYEHEWAKLEATARLKGYVPTLTFRHVRELLRKSRIKAPTPSSKVDVPSTG